MAWWIPVLQAIGINAGKNILTGQNPLKGGVEAGITGGVTGGFGGEGGLLGNTIPGAEATSAAQNIIPGSIESELGMAGADGVFRNKDYFANVLGTPVYTGGEGLLSNVASEAGSMLGNLTPENLSGVASLLGEQQDTSQYQQMAGTGGGMKQGSGGNLAVQFPQAKVFKRRKV